MHPTVFWNSSFQWNQKSVKRPMKQLVFPRNMAPELSIAISTVNRCYLRAAMFCFGPSFAYLFKKLMSKLKHTDNQRLHITRASLVYNHNPQTSLSSKVYEKVSYSTGGSKFSPITVPSLVHEGNWVYVSHLKNCPWKKYPPLCLQ